MASITHRPDGHRWIQFVGANGKRHTIRLGRASKRTAEGIKCRVEHLLECRVLNRPMEPDLANWVAGLEPPLAKKLSRVGLIPSREHQNTRLGAFLSDYVESRTDVKPATKEVWRQGANGLIEFFGADKPLRAVMPGDADGYRLYLTGTALAPMTVRKRLQFATMVFRAALRRRLIGENPFSDVSVKAVMRQDRQRFITPSETASLLEACPNHHWRAIVALARYGGLRCPSEVLSVRWQDVDWSAGRIVVQSPKTEHHPGKDRRTIPLFPELRPILEESFDLAPDGATYVCDERMREASQGKSGWRNCNLRTQFERIVKRAGMTPWPRLFHNLRSSRQTELAEKFPAHVVCTWLGNSEAVARKHYFQVTEDHFSRAVEATTKAKQNPKQLAAVSPGRDSHTESPPLEFAEENDTLRNYTNVQADGEGFEPPVPFGTVVFKTTAFDHSATHPNNFAAE